MYATQMRIVNVSQAVARLDPDEKGSICFTDAIGRGHEMLVALSIVFIVLKP